MNSRVATALVLLALIGCGGSSAPDPTTGGQPAVPALACPSFATVTQVAAMSATQGPTAHACDGAFGPAPPSLAVMDGQTMLGAVVDVSGVLNGSSCTFTFALVRSISDNSGSCTSSTEYTVTVSAVAK